MACALLAFACTLDAAAAPRLHCQLRNGDTVVDTEAAPTTDPYRVAALKVNRFRFKAVVAGEGSRVEYVKLYTYYDAGGKTGADAMRNVRLLHEASYAAPRPQRGDAATSLTGTVNVYEPTLGREFSYDCTLREDDA